MFESFQQTTIKKLKLKSWGYVGDILELVCYEIFIRKVLKLKSTHESLPTALAHAVGVNRCRNEIADHYEEICSRFSDTASHKIDFTSYGLHRDHPQA